MPHLFLLAGPNGAGKSTSAPEILRGSRILVAARRDVAFETTLASRTLLPRIQAMQRSGYVVHLTFFWLPSTNMAIERVARRVAAGGHSIPADVIRRRYERGLENFFNVYLQVADTWVLVNNTSRPGRPVAWQRIGSDVEVLDNDLWNRLVRYVKPRAQEPRVVAMDDAEIAQLRKIFDPQDIVDAVNRAVTAAYKRHKERGESIVIWRDGKIVTLKPEEIEV